MNIKVTLLRPPGPQAAVDGGQSFMSLAESMYAGRPVTFEGTFSGKAGYAVFKVRAIHLGKAAGTFGFSLSALRRASAAEAARWPG
jgi:hypothetical protein